MTDASRLLTAAEAAEWLHVKPRTVTLMVREGRLAGTKVGRQYLIPESELVKLVPTTKGN